MSDTISKSSLLKDLDKRIKANEFYETAAELAILISDIKSGRFDTDNSGEWKAVSEMAQREKQVLYDTLKDAQTYISNGYEYGYIDDREGYTEKILRKIERALMKGEDTE